MRFRGLVFDLDGTLVDSRGDIVRACNAALVAVGRAALSESSILSFVGDGARLLLARASGTTEDDPLVDALLGPYMADYLARPIERTTLMPGVADALATLARAIPLAVCTNKPRALAEAVLDGLGLSVHFRALVAAGDAPTRKPEPEMVVLACDRLGLPKAALSFAAMIGDSAVDVRAGRAAGTYTVGIEGPFGNGAELVTEKPDVLLRSFADLTAVVL
jgi:2-phosphoglycolate phosphatase